MSNEKAWYSNFFCNGLYGKKYILNETTFLFKLIFPSCLEGFISVIFMHIYALFSDLKRIIFAAIEFKN